MLGDDIYAHLQSRVQPHASSQLMNRNEARSGDEQGIMTEEGNGTGEET